jgi:hypothetical protein
VGFSFRRNLEGVVASVDSAFEALFTEDVYIHSVI